RWPKCSLQPVGVGTCAAHALRQGFSVWARRCKHFGTQQTTHAAAAHTRNAIVTRLFRQKINDFERMPKLHSRFVQSLRNLDTGQYADDAVEAPAIDHRITMGSGDQRRQVTTPGAATDQVAR